MGFAWPKDVQFGLYGGFKLGQGKAGMYAKLGRILSTDVMDEFYAPLG